MRKGFPTYLAFAKASLSDLLGEDALEASMRKSVTELRSCLFLNDGKGNFTKVPLPALAQAAPVFDFGIDDFNGDGLPDLIPVGNHFQVSTQLGGPDALRGPVFLGSQSGTINGLRSELPP